MASYPHLPGLDAWWKLSPSAPAVLEVSSWHRNSCGCAGCVPGFLKENSKTQSNSWARSCSRPDLKAGLSRVPRLVQGFSLAPSSATRPTSGSFSRSLESPFPAASAWPKAQGRNRPLPRGPQSPAGLCPQTTQTSKQALPLTELSSVLRKETIDFHIK